MNHKFCVDLGCASILIGENSSPPIKEPSVVALHRRGGVVAAVGVDAKDASVLSSPDMALLRPFRDGLTTNYDVTYHVLDTVLKRSFGRATRGAELLLSVPCDIDPLAETELMEAALRTGAKTCRLLYSPLAVMASVGITPQCDCLAIDIGAARTNIMLL